MIGLNDSKVAHWKPTAAPVNTHLFLWTNSEPIVFKIKFMIFQNYVNIEYGRSPYWGHLWLNILRWYRLSKDYLFRSTYGPQTDTSTSVLEKMPKQTKKRGSWPSTLRHLQPLRCPCSQISAAATSAGGKRDSSIFLFVLPCGDSIIAISFAAKIQRPVLWSGPVSVGLGLRAARLTP